MYSKYHAITMREALVFLFSLLTICSGAKILNNQYYVTPADFGCVTGNATMAVHNSIKLQEMVNYAIKNGIKVIDHAKNQYYIAGSIVIDGPINIDLNRASFIATDTIDMIVIKGKGIQYAGVISGFHLDLNNVAKSDIKGNNAIKVRITNGNITGIPANGVGMTIETGCEVFVDNMHFEGGENQATGLKVNTADCHFSDIVMINCHTAVDNRGINSFERIHAWIGCKGKWLDGSIFFKIRGWGPIFLNQCFCDTYDIGFQIECKTYLFISQFRNFQNKVMWKRDVEKIHPMLFQFTNATIAKESNIILDSSYIGGLFIDNENRQLFSDKSNHQVKLLNTIIE